MATSTASCADPPCNTCPERAGNNSIMVRPNRPFSAVSASKSLRSDWPNKCRKPAISWSTKEDDGTTGASRSIGSRDKPQKDTANINIAVSQAALTFTRATSAAPRAGPTMRAILKDMAEYPTALGSASRVTRSGKRARRIGECSEVATPRVPASASKAGRSYQPSQVVRAPASVMAL